MTTYPMARKKSPDPSPVLLQLLVALGAGFGLFFLFLLILLLGSHMAYAGQIYPGVSVAGIDLSGLTESQATVLLAQKMTFPQTGKIVFQDGERTWLARPTDLGLMVDALPNAQAAYDLGRQGNPIARLADQLGAWHSGKDIPAQLIYDERVALNYLLGVAAEVDRPMQEASLKVEGVEVIAVPGQVGRTVDVHATLEALREQMSRLTDGAVPLVINEATPGIMDASAQAEVARQILSAPLTLSIPDAKAGDPGPYVIPPQQLAGMLVIERVQDQGSERYQVELSDAALNTYLTALAGDINRQPENARFMFNDETHLLEVIKPAVIGRNLDVYSTIGAINQSIAAGQHSAPLTLVVNQPQVGDTATGEQLGITENIVTYTSYFRGSTTERLQNIEKAAANFHGLLIPPGATFSMADAMGNVSLDEGYAEAWIIFGGRTIKGVGGGVCQVSTTLFRAAFFAGFPIIERHPHAYRVGYYEQTANSWDDQMAGLDATVFLPMVDFQFVNDSPHWLLMETYYRPNSRSLTWKFYSTSDGRTVEWETSGPQNVVDPPDPVYEENPDLAQGKIIQVDWAAEGADVTVLRTVYRDGAAIFTDSFVTHYLPWADVYQYGPGTELPKKVRQPNLNP
jgi:vancomycin resistance protein YoaR